MVEKSEDSQEDKICIRKKPEAFKRMKHVKRTERMAVGME
jgi:hypothetical protein